MRPRFAFLACLVLALLLPACSRTDERTVLRRLGNRDPEAMALIAAGLEITAAPPSGVPERIAEKMEAVFRSLGMATRLSGLGIAREQLPQVLEISLKNFNADPRREFVRERGMLEELLAAAW